MLKKLRDTFRPESCYRQFFLSLLTMGLANSAYAASIKPGKSRS